MSFYVSGHMAAVEENKRLAAERIAYKTTASTNEILREINKNLDEIKAIMHDLIMIMKYTNQTAYAQAKIQKAYEETLDDGKSA